MGLAVKALLRGRRALETGRNAPQFVPPGHYYSPVPPLSEIRAREALIFAVPRQISAVDLREPAQLELLQALSGYYRDQPFPVQRSPERRYWLNNLSFNYSDGIVLQAMIRHVRPRRIIEIGSGWSSCAMLDTNELFFDNQIQLTFIDPYPKTLRSLMRSEDEERAEILEIPIQDVSLDRFRGLEPGDILFVDSTHVSRVGSDVNRIIFEILPSVKPGVLIHFHDIFYPFEYPKAWILEGRVWSEAYLLRAFLEYNSAFEIALFGTYLARFHKAFFEQHMPLCLKDTGGSLWLRRVC